MRQLKLFHFDLRTAGNYGDTLLFEAVRSVFHGIADGRAFDVYDSASLREPVGPGTVDYINETADAVVIGGGGLFLSDTNANQRSGWQWNISLPALRKINKPLIIFAVGNNRFIGQPDFSPPFAEHLELTVRKAAFVGLRNHGSIDTIRPYLPEELREDVVYQPCPTTLSQLLYPDLGGAQTEEKVLGVQHVVGKRQVRAGFDVDDIRDKTFAVLRRLREESWTIHGMPFARADEQFDTELAEAGLRDRYSQLWGHPADVLFRGTEELGRIPLFLGTRGHAQMVPFGMGALPFSVMVHNKLRYFATDIDRGQWAIDPREPDFEERLHREITTGHANLAAERAHLAQRQAELMQLTLDNLSQIYGRVADSSLDDQSFTPFGPRERRGAQQLFISGLRADRVRGDLQTLQSERAAAAKAAQQQAAEEQAATAAEEQAATAAEAAARPAASSYPPAAAAGPSVGSQAAATVRTVAGRVRRRVRDARRRASAGR